MKRVALIPAIIIAVILSLFMAIWVFAADVIEIETLISVDGDEWQDADDIPGPIVETDSSVSYRYEITGTFESDLTPVDYTLTDTGQSYSTTGTLSPEDPTHIIEIVGLAVVEGQYSSVGVVTAGELGDDDPVNYYGVLPLEEVVIDLKPGSDPNSINLKSQGVTPLALLSTAEGFDATTIELESATIYFAGAEPVRWAIEDVNGDGLLDVIFHFRTQDLDLTETSESAVFTISYSHEGLEDPVAQYSSEDSVNIVPKGNGNGNSNSNGNGHGNGNGNGNSK